MVEKDTATKILEAARRCLLADGYAAMSTRKVAEEAGVPLSQIHYHFGSKDELILALLRAENEGLLGRQTEMFERELPLWQRWNMACDYFDEDIASGYVRVVHEMTAAGWSSEVLGKEMRGIWGGWIALLVEVAKDAEAKGLFLGGFTPEEVVALVSAGFVGAESFILLGMEREGPPYRRALRRVGDLIRIAEEEAAHAS
jgi:AcrR family transcriptional regulator